MTELHPRAWRSTWLLLFAMTLCTLDRTLPNVVGDPIRRSLDLSDTQLSLLVGMAFASCYAICALPISWIADRYSRPRVIAIGIAVWCIATAACGYATGFNSMFALRMGVGVGEAALVPATVSLLADLMPRSMLPRAVGLVNAGGLFGIALAYPAGSVLAKSLEGTTIESLAWLPSEGWRLTFILIGVAGLLFVPLILGLPEPRKGREIMIERQPDLQESLPSYLKRSASFTVPLLACLVLLNLYANGYLVWLAPYFTRTHQWELAKVGQYLGVTVLGAGIAGSLLGGWVTSALTRRLQRDAAMSVSVLAVALLAPLAIFTPFAPNGEIAMALIGLQLTLAFGATATLPTVLVNTSPAHLRARFFATNLFLGQLIGAGLGSTIFAVITDYLLHDENKLYLSLAIGATAIFIPLVGLLWRTATQYQSALNRVEQQAEAFVEAQSPRGVLYGKLPLSTEG